MNELKFNGKGLKGFNTIKVSGNDEEGFQITCGVARSQKASQVINIKDFDYIEVHGDLNTFHSNNCGKVIGKVGYACARNCLTVVGSIKKEASVEYLQRNQWGIIKGGEDVLYGKDYLYYSFVRGFATEEDLNKKLRIVHINLDSPCTMTHIGDRYTVIIGNVTHFTCDNCGEIKGEVLAKADAGNRIYLKDKNSGYDWRKEAQNRIDRQKSFRSEMDGLFKGGFVK